MDFLEQWEARGAAERRSLFGSVRDAVADDPGGLVPATATQKAILSLELEAGDVSPYTIGYAFDLRGGYEPERLIEAVESAVGHHAVLRTRFEVSEHGDVLSYLHDDEGTVTVETVADIEARLDELAAAPLDVESGEVFAAWLLRTDDDHPDALVLKAHHIAVDGQSLAVLIDEILARYSEQPVEELPDQFRGLQVAGVVDAANELSEDAEAWWRAHVGFAAVSMLPPDRPPGSASRFIGGHQRFEVPASVWRDAAAVTAATGTGAAVLGLLVIGAVTARYSGQWDATYGMSVAGRSTGRLLRVVGPFADSVPVHLDLDPAQTPSSALRQLATGPANGHLPYESPFSAIVQALQPPRRDGLNPLYNVLVTVDAQAVDDVMDVVPGFAVCRRELTNGTARVPFQVTVGAPTDAGITLRIDYATAYYTDEFITRIGRDLVEAFAGVAHDIALGDLGRRDAGEVLVGAELDLADDVIESFRASVARWGDRPALRRDQTVITYRELSERAETLGRLLTEHGARVAIVDVDHGPDLTVALVGCLLSGTAYVPASADLPTGRIDAMSRITEADTLLAVASDGFVVRSLRAGASGEDTSELRGQRAYAMFTSGSTGEPKAVWVGRAALSHYAAAAVAAGLIRPGDRVLALTSPTFDISMDELLVPLTVGGTTVFGRNGAGLLGVGDAVDALNAGDVDVVHGTPSLMRALIAEGWEPAARRPRVVVGGERLSASLAGELLRRAAEVRNVYGPTEATVWATVATVGASVGDPLIGGPLPGYRIRLAAADPERDVAPGEVGEILIGGPALADGYGGSPDAAVARFRKIKGERWYLTGDLARVVGDSLRFLGRRDEQVKVRGHRIELGELEAIAKTVPAALDAAAASDGERLFLLVRGAAKKAALAQAFAARLPRPVRPDVVCVTTEPLPLSTNGKLDRSAVQRAVERLAAAEDAAGPSDVRVDSPAHPADEDLAEFEAWVTERWEIMLRRRIGRTSNLFDVGGHSLVLARTVAMARDQLGLTLSISDIYADPTPAGVSARLRDEALRVLD